MKNEDVNSTKKGAPPLPAQIILLSSPLPFSGRYLAYLARYLSGLYLSCPLARPASSPGPLSLPPPPRVLGRSQATL